MSEFLFGLFLGVLIVMIPVSCVAKDNKNLVNPYQVIEIDGMTCIEWENQTRSGFTCNWNEWKGEAR